MKVLVTGGAGFIGSNTVDHLLDKGHDVVVVDDLSTGRKENINPQAAFHEVDITSDGLDGVFKKEKPSHAVHLAAHIDVRKSVANPMYDASVNVIGTINLLESCRRHEVKKFVYASSGGAIYGEPEYNPVDEKHPIKPLSPYGVSKYAAEKYVETYSALHGVDYVILRYGNVYGPRQDPLGEAGVVAIFTGLLAENKQPIIFGDGMQSRDFCYVGDVAEANLTALKKDAPGAYNIGSGVETTVNDVASQLITAVGADVEPKHSDPVPGEVRNICLDVSLARQRLGWKPVISLEEGVAKTFEWAGNR